MIRFLLVCLLLVCAPFAQASFPATVTNSSSCTVAPCYEYRISSASAEWHSTPEAACRAWTNGYTYYSHTETVCQTQINGAGTPSTWSISRRDAAPATPVYSCPASSTLSGSTCTCTPPAVQQGTGTGATCSAPQACAWAKDMQVAGGSFMIETGKNFCHSGCTFTLAPDAGPSPFRAKQDGKWYEQRWQGDFKGTGTGATSCGVGDAEEEPTIDPPEDKPEAPDQPCPPGQTAGPQIIAPGGGGGYACMTPEETEARKKKTVEKTEPDGSTSTTTTEETTICGQDSCNTTTNTSVSSGGTTQITTETSSTSKDTFCKSNPSDKNCTGSAGGSSPGSPGAQGTPGVPALYEQKYPDGIAGVWTAKKNALLATPLGQLTTQLMPNIPAGGSLPVWNLNLDLGGSWDFGTYDVAPSAQVWEWAGVFIIIGALLLARALIFGG